LLEALSQKFDLKLGTTGELYEESLLRRSESSRWASLLQHHFPEAAALYDQLNERAGQGPQGAALAGPAGQFLPVEDWALHDWLDRRVLEVRHRSRLEQLGRELSQAQADLLAARALGEQLQCQLRQTEAVLSQTRASLSQAGAELAQAQSHLLQTQAILSQTQADLARARDDLVLAEARSHQSRELVSNMESSKFWKLRKVWFRVKGAARLTE
jgi:hypothetical protein